MSKQDEYRAAIIGSWVAAGDHRIPCKVVDLDCVSTSSTYFLVKLEPAPEGFHLNHKGYGVVHGRQEHIFMGSKREVLEANLKHFEEKVLRLGTELIAAQVRLEETETDLAEEAGR